MSWFCPQTYALDSSLLCDSEVTSFVDMIDIYELIKDREFI